MHDVYLAAPEYLRQGACHKKLGLHNIWEILLQQPAHQLPVMLQHRQLPMLCSEEDLVPKLLLHFLESCQFDVHVLPHGPDALRGTAES